MPLGRKQKFKEELVNFWTWLGCLPLLPLSVAPLKNETWNLEEQGSTFN